MLDLATYKKKASVILFLEEDEKLKTK